MADHEQIIGKSAEAKSIPKKKLRTVLVIDDETEIQRLLGPILEQDGFLVLQAPTGAKALKILVQRRPDLVVLDLILPDYDGIDLLVRLRCWSNVPVIVLSARSSEADKVQLLKAGADDYIVKPFGLAEFLARVHSVMRRPNQMVKNAITATFGSLTVNFATNTATRNNSVVALTRKEYRALRILARHHGAVVSQEYLVNEIWGSQKKSVNNKQHLRVLIGKLRTKIEIDPSRPTILITERAVGFRLADLRPKCLD
jgi:two-component system, OmpR family, KDP operon response regulator KdpE